MRSLNLFLGESAKSVKISNELYGEYNNSRSSWLHSLSTTNPLAVHGEKHLPAVAINYQQHTNYLDSTTVTSTLQQTAATTTTTHQTKHQQHQQQIWEYSHLEQLEVDLLSDTVLNELLDDLACSSSAPELYRELEFGHGGIANREGWHLQQQQQQHQQLETITTDATTMGNQQPQILVSSDATASGHINVVVAAPLGSDSCATGEQLETPQIELKKEFDFPLCGIEHETYKINSNNSNNIISINIKKPEEISTEDTWTLMSPIGSTNGVGGVAQELPSPSSSTSMASPPPTANQLFDTNVESQYMCFDDFDTPPLTFEDEIQKMGQAIDDEYKGMMSHIEERAGNNIAAPTNYNLNAIMPSTTTAATYSQSNEEATLDAAATVGSQDGVLNPTNIHIFSQDSPLMDEDTEWTEPLKTEQPEIIHETPLFSSNNNNNLEHNYTQSVDAPQVKGYQGRTATTTINIDDIRPSQTQRVPKLKLKLPKPVQALQEFESKEVNTPQITNEILSLEREFDLISYITNDVSAEIVEEPEIIKQEEETSSSTSSPPLVEKRKRKISFIDEEPQVKRSRDYSYHNRTRASSPSTSISSEYINPSSVQSATSDDSFTPNSRPAKRRGRPPKPVPTLLDENELANLSPEDKRYRELRNKNNEASRRSRLNRKDREGQLEDEARLLEEQFDRLEHEEQKLITKCARWRDAVMKLALL